MPLRLVAFDMDGTLVDVDSSFAVVHRYFGESNPEALERFLRDEISDLEFMQSDLAIWRRHRPDLREQDLVEILRSVPLMPGARVLFDRLHRARLRTAIVSGGLDVLAQRVGRELGVDDIFANSYVLDAEGRLTQEGIIRVPIKSKREVLARLQGRLGVSPEECAAVGNSDIDVGMFERSRLRIAFLPADAHVRRAATHVINEKDLSRLVPLLTETEPGGVR
jgi:phosphoserine phosphatase